MYNGVQPNMYYTNSTYPVTGGPLLGDFFYFLFAMSMPGTTVRFDRSVVRVSKT